MTDVLDKGFINLVRIDGSETDVVNAARVCTGSSGDPQRDEKLLRYLYTHGHTSPLEMMAFQFHVKCPIFVSRQWMRHRTWSYNEASQRYKESPLDFYVPVELHNKNNTEKALSSTFLWPDKDEYFNSLYAQLANCYKQLHELGLPYEQARIVLPLATYTEFMGHVDLNNLLKFLDQRLDPGAQWEIRQYAQAIVELVTPHAPVTMEMFNAKRSV